MALVRFFRDKEDKYLTECTVGGVRYPWNYTKYNNAVFFAKDTTSIWMNGSRYRMNPELESKLSRGRILQNVSSNSDSGIITFTFIEGNPIELDLRDCLGIASYSNPGLMSPSHVTKIDSLDEDVKTLSNKVENMESIFVGAMHFIGVFEKVPVYVSSLNGSGWSFDGTTIIPDLKFIAGDVILVGEKEFICDKNNKFIEFGDTSDFATSDDLKKLEDRVTKAENKLEEVEEQVTKNTEDIATNKENIANNTATLKDHEVRISSLEECLTWNNKQ